MFALFVLRRREPNAVRPFKALGYPVAPASGRAFFPPRPVAPGSGMPPESRLSDGRGTIYSVTCIAGRAGPRIMALVAHPYIMGPPHRLRYFRETLQHMQSRPGVLVWTGEQILERP